MVAPLSTLQRVQRQGKAWGPLTTMIARIALLKMRKWRWWQVGAGV
jgi:hypothetical protein